MKRAKLISIGQIKGGAGKSVSTNMLAIWLQTVKNKKVLVVDCDSDSSAISLWRNDDINHGLNDKDSYDLLPTVLAEDFILYWEKYMMDYDYIFVDLPGDTKQIGVKEAYILCDLILFPITHHKEVYSAANKLNEWILNDFNPLREKVGQNPTETYAFFSAVSKETSAFKEIYEMRNEFNYKVLDTIIPFNDKSFQEKNTIELNRQSVHFSKYHSTWALEVYEIINKLKIENYG